MVISFKLIYNNLHKLSNLMIIWHFNLSFMKKLILVVYNTNVIVILKIVINYFKNTP
jgi:hypothetical protein